MLFLKVMSTTPAMLTLTAAPLSSPARPTCPSRPAFGHQIPLCQAILPWASCPKVSLHTEGANRSQRIMQDDTTHPHGLCLCLPWRRFSFLVGLGALQGQSQLSSRWQLSNVYRLSCFHGQACLHLSRSAFRQNIQPGRNPFKAMEAIQGLFMLMIIVH